MKKTVSIITMCVVVMALFSSCIQSMPIDSVMIEVNGYNVNEERSVHMQTFDGTQYDVFEEDVLVLEDQDAGMGILLNEVQVIAWGETVTILPIGTTEDYLMFATTKQELTPENISENPIEDDDIVPIVGLFAEKEGETNTYARNYSEGYTIEELLTVNGVSYYWVVINEVPDLDISSEKKAEIQELIDTADSYIGKIFIYAPIEKEEKK